MVSCPAQLEEYLANCSKDHRDELPLRRIQSASALQKESRVLIVLKPDTLIITMR